MVAHDPETPENQNKTPRRSAPRLSSAASLSLSLVPLFADLSCVSRAFLCVCAAADRVPIQLTCVSQFARHLPEYDLFPFLEVLEGAS